MQLIDNRKILGAVVYGLLGVAPSLLLANAMSEPTDASRDSTQSTVSSPQPVALQYHDVSLIDAMTDVARRSKIAIYVSADMQSNNINISAHGADWNSAVTALLANFNHLAIVDRKGQFRKIWITGKKDASELADGVAASTRGDNTQLDDLAESTLTNRLPKPIWQPLEDQPGAAEIESAKSSIPIQVNPEFFASVQVGQPVEIPIPQEQSPLYGVVGETHSQLGGQVEVWSGPIDGSHETASFTITRGERTTYVTVATGTSIYEASFENSSGTGSVVNEVELTKDVTEDDFVVPEEADASSGTD